MRPFVNVISMLAIAAGVLCFSSPATAADVTIIVPTDYSSIQSAIDQAFLLWSQPSNTLTYEVLVEPGTYSGDIILKSNIPVRGRETARTVISGGSSGTLMAASGVTGVSIRNFTFRNAQVGIAVSSNSTLRVENNVFSVGTSGTAVNITASTSTTVVNNTFYLNGTAVFRDSDSVVDNNVFSDNTTNISQNIVLDTNITYNVFDPDNPSEYRGTNYIPNTTFPNPDPLFVNPISYDLHVKNGSPCINTGDPLLSGVLDRGTYGGPATDNIPYPVANVTSSTTSSNEVTISWSQNLDYRVSGYNVYYGFSSKSRSNTAVVTGATSTLISGLTGTAAAPGQPVMSEPEPRNGKLVLSWSSVPGTTSYTIHYALASAPTLTIDKAVGNVTSYTLSDLVNYQTYNIAVSAEAQQALYTQVTASYPSPCSSPTIGPGVGCESAYSDEAVTYFGDVAVGPNSDVVQGTPEFLTAYPDLPNTGCFIATAAYGSRDVLPVRILRTFRDRWLLTNGPGRAFVAWYYRTSPPMAAYMDRHPLLKPLVRVLLAPLVAFAIVLIYAPWALIPGAAALFFVIRRSIPRRGIS
jgi:hypothetical protein